MKALRFSAQLIGFQLSAFFLFFLIGEGAAGFLEGKFKSFFLVILMLSAIGGFIFALKNPKLGAFVMISSSILMGIYLLILAEFSEWKMSVLFGLPFIIIGILFYFSRDLEKIKSTSIE